MTTPAKADVSDATENVLGALSRGDPDLLAAGLGVRAEWQAGSGLDDRSYALVTPATGRKSEVFAAPVSVQLP